MGFESKLVTAADWSKAAIPVAWTFMSENSPRESPGERLLSHETQFDSVAQPCDGKNSSDKTVTRATQILLLGIKTKAASGKNSRKPRSSELEQGGYRTVSSSFPPQVDVTIGPYQTGPPGCSSSTDCCAIVKGRMPEDQLVELELALLPEQELAVAVLKQELKPVLQCNPCFRNHCYHIQFRSNPFRSNHHSIRQPLRIHMLSEPVLLHGGPIGRSQPVSRSGQKPRMGCSSIGSGEPDHQFRQQLLGELVHPCHSDRRRMRS